MVGSGSIINNSESRTPGGYKEMSSISYMSPKAGGGDCGVSAYEYSCAHGAQISFGDLTPLTYEEHCLPSHPKHTHTHTVITTSATLKLYIYWYIIMFMSYLLFN